MGEVRKYLQKTVHKMKGGMRILNSMSAWHGGEIHSFVTYPLRQNVFWMEKGLATTMENKALQRWDSFL